ncbi:MAG: hypothetical protein ACNS64_13990 [Candidatus Halalkalibacterium sp. M3_1C_030]
MSSLAKPPEIMGYRIDPTMPLHKLAEKRINSGRDLKMIITAKDSQTGVGKTTLAGWLALSWTKHFAGQDWFVEPEEYGVGMGTLNPKEYFSILQKIPHEYDAGTVCIVDDAEELDARRSMQGLNVEFSQRWMLMRLKQAITIITLPSPKAIDSRLEELSDIWINIERRGRGFVHDIRVNSYGSRNVMTEQKHKITFPDVSTHPELETLREMKEDKIKEWDADEEEDETPDPKEVERDEKIRVAQKARDKGYTCKEASELVDMSVGWISNNTESPEE